MNYYILGNFMVFTDCDDVLVSTRDKIQGEIDKATDAFPTKELLSADINFKKGITLLQELNNSRSQHALARLNAIRHQITHSMMSFNDIRRELNLLRNYPNFPREIVTPIDDDKFYFAIDLISDGIIRREMYLEERDHFMELDNPKPNGLINYNPMYTLDCVSPEARQYMAEMNAYAKDSFVITHHNAGREVVSKEGLIIRDLHSKFIGVKFHKQEYVSGFRRPRQSKAEYVKEVFGIYDLSNCVLVDDSLDNINSWIENGGIGILYDPENKHQSNNRYMVIHALRVIEIVACLYDYIDKHPIMFLK